MKQPHTEQNAGYAALCKLVQQAKGKKSLSIPLKTVSQMLVEYEDLLDVVAYDAATASAQEFFPQEVADRLIAGEHPLKVYREYRGLTQQLLAKASGVSRDMIAMMETGKKNGSLATVKKLSQTLNIDIEDIS